MNPILNRQRTTLVVVDVQEAFRNVIYGFTAIVERCAVLVQGARILDLPILVTEQYPQGLGATVDELSIHLEGIPRIEKTAFSAVGASGFDLDGRDQVLICGIETHICVSQTVHQLLSNDVQVHVASDAVASRTAADRQAGLDRMSGSGAVLSSSEMALFELLERAGTDEFKAIQRLVI